MKKLVSSFIFSILLLSGNGWGATYYVDRSGGDDAKNGLSPENAWRTIAKVNASNFAAGDSILFKRGETWRESLTVPSSGSAGNPVTIAAYGTGAKPIIQPTNVIPGPWTRVGATNVYYATYASIPLQVFVENEYCRPAHWPAAAGSSPPSFAYPSSNSGDSVHLIDNALHGKASSDLVGAQLRIYTNPWTQKTATVSAWDDVTSAMTIDDISVNPATSMRYYLTGMVWMITENTWVYDSGTQRLYIWKKGGGDPTTATVEASSNNSAINATDKSNITIDSMVVRFAGHYGIYINNWNSNVSNVFINNSEAHYNGKVGIFLSPIQSSRGYTIDNTTVYNNFVDHNIENGILYQGSVSGSYIRSNTITNSGGVYPHLPGAGMGILTSITAGVIDNNAISGVAYNGILHSGNDGAITNNTISHTNIYLEDGGGTYTTNNNILISRNTFIDTGNGIYFDAGADNSVVEYNTITGGTKGMVWVNASNITARWNKLIGPFSSGYAIIVNSDHSNTGILSYNIINCQNNACEGIRLGTRANSSIDIYNNNIVNCGVGIWIANVNQGVRNVKNNIFYNNTVNIRAASGNATSINNNLYHGTGAWTWGAAEATIATFASWKAVSSYDGASITGDPRFISTSDFRLTAGSPAIDAGTNVGLTSDYFGNNVPFGPAPDIGAHESNSGGGGGGGGVGGGVGSGVGGDAGVGGGGGCSISPEGKLNGENRFGTILALFSPLIYIVFVKIFSRKKYFL